VSKRRTVVLVEDHALTRAGLRTALEAEAFVVVAEAGDGLVGFDAIVKERPNVAVIDIGLPGIDGIELTRRVRRSSPETRIAILTMRDSEEEVLAALSAGADAYSVKTSRPEHIVAAVRTAADGGRSSTPRSYTS
jgi:DNA-binding NarL/FixJ family response regulator